MNDNSYTSKWKTVGFLISISFITSFNHFLNVDLTSLSDRIDLHNKIIQGTAQAPYNYRVLTPVINEIPIDLLSLIVSRRVSFGVVYAGFEFLCIFVFFSLFYRYLKKYFDGRDAIIGLLFTSLSMTIALRSHYFQPWSLTELVLIMLGILLIIEDKYYYLVIVLTLSVINRSSGLILLIFYASYTFDYSNVKSKKMPMSLKDLSKIIIATIPAVVILIVVRNFRHAPRNITISEVLMKNIDYFPLNIVFIAMFMGIVGWLFVIFGLYSAPRDVRKFYPVLIVYIPLIFIFGIWSEVRLLMVLYPIFIPALISYLNGTDNVI